MNPISQKIGYWSALLSAISLILFMLSFIGVILSPPLFLWTDLPAFIQYTTENNSIFPILARVCSLALAPLFLILFNALYDYAPADKKILARISLHCILASAVLIGLHYFVQLTAVPHSLANNQTTGIEQFIQANPDSPILAINMLGWTLFLGLASLFIAPFFSQQSTGKINSYPFLDQCDVLFGWWHRLCLANCLAH